MKILSIILFVLVVQLGLAQSINFDDFYEKGSLRVDFLFYGNSTDKSVSIHRMKRDEHFGGGTSSQLIYPQYGNYNVLVKDAKTGKTIFSKGFSPIFDEWQATDEAKKVTKAFENSVQMPFPKAEIIFEIQDRGADGKFKTIFSQNINPTDYNILKEPAKQYAVSEIYKNGKPSQMVDIAIIAEGYTKEEMAKFRADARRLSEYMFSIPPFSEFKNKFNIYAIESPSEESGTDVPGENIYKNTILDSRFYTFGVERYLTTTSSFKLADIAANVPYDQIYVLVNTDRYGGGGFYNVINLVSADDKLSDKVFVHEFGHGFVGLADEYYTSEVATDSYYNLKLEPWEQNITTMVNFDAKWKDLVKKKTPIPTPRTPKYEKEVGVFEGGGYSAKGIYSPVQDCRMKSNTPDGFCPVCSRTIADVIEFYTR